MVVLDDKRQQVFHLSAHQEREAVNVLQRNTGTPGHTVQGILGHNEGNADLISQTFIETTQQSTATSEVDAILNNICIQSCRCSGLFPDSIQEHPWEGL